MAASLTSLSKSSSLGSFGQGNYRTKAQLGSRIRPSGFAVEEARWPGVLGCGAAAARPEQQASLATITAAAALMLSLASPDAVYASGEAVFGTSCAACHRGGGNIVQPGATLTLGDLQRNGVLDVDKIYQLTYSGKGKMYGFGEGCMPKGKCAFGPRLSDTDIRDVSQYIFDKANSGW